MCNEAITCCMVPYSNSNMIWAATESLIYQRTNSCLSIYTFPFLNLSNHSIFEFADIPDVAQSPRSLDMQSSMQLYTHNILPSSELNDTIQRLSISMCNCSPSTLGVQDFSIALFWKSFASQRMVVYFSQSHFFSEIFWKDIFKNSLCWLIKFYSYDSSFRTNLLLTRLSSLFL